VTALGKTYDFHRVAGTSAGRSSRRSSRRALTDDLESMMVGTDFAQFEDQGGGMLRHLGRVGQGEGVLSHEGIYKGEALHSWISSMLAKGGVRTWGDVRIARYGQFDADRGAVSARRRGLRHFPWTDTAPALGLPRSARRGPRHHAGRRRGPCVRIDPVLFRPWHLPVRKDLAAGHDKLVLADGGMLSNSPVDLFDQDTDHLTIGVKLSARLSLQQRGWHASNDRCRWAKR
jgi:NTE family protein